MDAETFKANVIQWAEARNLIEGSDPSAQFGKLLEEMTELYNALRTNNQPEIIDAIGDCAVVATIIGEQLRRNPVWEFYDPRMSILLWEAVNVFGMPQADRFSGVLMYRLSNTVDIDMETCRAAAWDAIKDRKGQMVDGVFVKEVE